MFGSIVYKETIYMFVKLPVKGIKDNNFHSYIKLYINFNFKGGTKGVL